MPIANIPSRSLDDNIRARLRVRAREHHRSMEAKAQVNLREAAARKPNPRTLANIARSVFGSNNGVDLELLPRDSTARSQ